MSCHDTTKGAQAIRASLMDNTVLVAVFDSLSAEVELPAGEYVALCVLPQAGAAGLALIQLQGVTPVDAAALIANNGNSARTSGFAASAVLPRRFEVFENTRVIVTSMMQLGTPVIVTFERLSPGGGL